MKSTIWSIFVLVITCSFIYADNRQTESDFKNEFLDRINRVRQQGCKCGTTYMPPVSPLVWNDDLAKAASAHAHDMFKYTYFNHTSRDGRNISDRIMAAGYNYKGFRSYAVGENIAAGQLSIAEVSDGWFKSVGHCKNLMNAGFRDIGIAEDHHYWVQDFGGREPFSAAEQKVLKNGGKLIMRRVTGGHNKE